MVQYLKTLRDLGLTATLVLTAFGSPVGVAALRDAPAMQTLVEAPIERAPVVYMPPAPPSEPSTLSSKPDEEAADSEAREGGTGVATPAVARRGLRAVAREGSSRGTATQGRALRPSTKKKKKTRRSCAPDNPQIAVRGDRDRVVERDLVDHYTGDLAALNRLGYVKKHVAEDGKKSDGLLVRGIRCGNDLHELGIRNNDIVHSVNGKKVRNLVQAIAVYMQLRGKKDFEVEITRGGKRLTMRYELV
jgi:hypothetical protein